MTGRRMSPRLRRIHRPGGGCAPILSLRGQQVLAGRAGFGRVPRRVWASVEAASQGPVCRDFQDASVGVDGECGRPVPQARAQRVRGGASGVGVLVEAANPGVYVQVTSGICGDRPTEVGILDLGPRVVRTERCAVIATNISGFCDVKISCRTRQLEHRRASLPGTQAEQALSAGIC